jgi:(1->4)-alpha-D-glucan 1-alpha-D-glucosylmutase
MTSVGPVASYRLQLTPADGFDHVIGLLDHLEALGISHLYLSPVAEAVPGSEHGYDVVDHTRVRAELGGADGLDRLFAAAAERGMRVVVDHVPNHASTSRPELNHRWWQMLRDGPGSPAARWFDVDADVADGRVVLPVLGRPLPEVIAAGDVVVAAGPEDHVDEPHVVVHGGLRLPLAPGTADGLSGAGGAGGAGVDIGELLDRQHYQLVHWREPVRNVRRFFTIDDLVAVRAEEPAVAAALDSLPVAWSAVPGFGGLRVDHVDGLADPLRYLAGLRERIGHDAWLVVEKILAPDETLPQSWPVDGTTGYEFARILDQVMIDPAAAPVFDRLWAEVVRDHEALSGTFHELEDRARREVLAGGLRPDVERTVRAAARALDVSDGSDGADVPGGGLAEVVVELTVRLPRYRTYLPADPDGERVLRSVADEVVAVLPERAALTARVVATLLDPPDEAGVAFRIRWQQLTGPAMAKGAEDRAFYRYLRFAPLCEVGGEPGRFGVPVLAFHEAQAQVQRSHPRTMITASTHDTKRSADVRARAAALTAEHSSFAEVASSWMGEIADVVDADLVDRAEIWHAIQTAVVCPGLDTGRLEAFLVKSAREADLRTSWTEPDEGHESELARLADVVVGHGRLAGSIADWAERLDGPGRAASVAATLARLTAPGVPDIYQGTEAFEYRLVDPDNRAAPDWRLLGELARVAARLDGPAVWRERPEAAKAVVIRRATALRRNRPEAFGVAGGYEPIEVSGRGAHRVLVFCRGGSVVSVMPLPGLEHLAGDDLALELPEGSWRDVLTDDAAPVSGRLALAGIFAAFPGALLERTS